MIESIYMTDFGEVRISSRTFRGDLGEMKIPDEVWRRGLRLQIRHGRCRFAYMAGWCDRKMAKVIYAQ